MDFCVQVLTKPMKGESQGIPQKTSLRVQRQMPMDQYHCKLSKNRASCVKTSTSMCENKLSKNRASCVKTKNGAEPALQFALKLYLM
jgi:hypothetical protein